MKRITGETLIELICRDLRLHDKLCTDSNIVAEIRNYGTLPLYDDCFKKED